MMMMTPITGLIKAGSHIVIDGNGTIENPYIVNADGGGPGDITGLIVPGGNVTITGSGTKTDPYVISAPELADLMRGGPGIMLQGGGTVAAPVEISVLLLGLLKMGTNITRTGIGSGKSPMVISANATDLIKAGTNVTLTGTGTNTDPYVISAAGGGTVERTQVTAGKNVTVTGLGTAESPYVVNAVVPQPGKARRLDTDKYFAGAPDYVLDGDGYVSVLGMVSTELTLAPPMIKGEPVQFATLGPGYRPGDDAMFMVPAFVHNKAGDVTNWTYGTVWVDTVGGMYLYPPDVYSRSGEWIQVYLDGVRFLVAGRRGSGA